MSTLVLDKKPLISAGVAAVVAMFCAAPASAEDMTASVMLQKMNDREQYAYVSGVVAGLATARYVRDGEAGSACIDRWFGQTPGIKDTLYKAFERFGDKSPSAIIYAFAAKECGK